MPSRSKLPRISREDMFAIMALWMERFPLNGDNQPEQPPTNSGQFGVNKAGAVFVDANDRIVAMDCSRKRGDPSVQVHAAARVLIKLPNKVKGCTVYMSRKPCSFCVKLLVQAGVSRIRFLPLQPEASPNTNCSDLENAKRTENLVRVCPIGLSVYVPNLAELEDASSDDHDCIDIKAEYWSDSWKKELEEMKEGSERDIMRCSGFPDSKVIEAVGVRMIRVGKWIGRATDLLNNSTTFSPFKETLNGSDDPPLWQELCLHMSRMSLIHFQRTDDPNVGVGVIIVMKGEVVSVGLSGYPSKALFGDFPRNNDTSSGQGKKYPFLVHAEQNALLLRNILVIADESTTAFVTKTPCNRCAPLLFEAGVSKVVLPRKDLQLHKTQNQIFKQLHEGDNIRAFGISETKPSG